MKDIKIGKSEWTLIDNVDEINDKRFTYFKMYLLKSIEGIDKPLFKSTMERAIALFNQQKNFQAIAEFQNYLHSIEYESYNDDALSKCFALICLEPNEDQTNVDEEYLNKKLETMWSNGLTRGFVEESVSNFTMASPLSFGDYSHRLQAVMTNFDSIQSIGSKDSQKKQTKQAD